ncbi:alpha/beta fold hydrolase [Pararhodobacter sp. CCB-MM2]|uniref:alpha/beta fold hydrolase n=1 Tax=Pararhodobacter sp. CCB-MM2 TaxID=1786003 RepID=UPI00082A99BA|nr:alpha/beta hydrolase [Pararhodobacter sp. CCB-MM2]
MTETKLHDWGAKHPGAPVILLHGWTMTGAIWDPVARLLNAPCLAPDLPGHGETEGYAPTVAGGVAQLSDLISDRGIEGATLVGWSLGALIGWSYLAQGGTGVARMVSLDMSPCPLPAPGWHFPMRGQSSGKALRGGQRFRQDWPSAARAISQQMFARPEGGSALSSLAAEKIIRAQDPDAMASFWESLVAVDLRAALGRIETPLLALHGAESRVYRPATGDWIAHHARHAEARVLEGCGHAPNLEDPDSTAAAIANFARLP